MNKGKGSMKAYELKARVVVEIEVSFQLRFKKDRGSEKGRLKKTDWKQRMAPLFVTNAYPEKYLYICLRLSI